MIIPFSVAIFYFAIRLRSHGICSIPNRSKQIILMQFSERKGHQTASSPMERNANGLSVNVNGTNRFGF